MKIDKALAIGGITVLGAIHIITLGDGTVLGLLIGALTTLAGVSFASKD